MGRKIVNAFDTLQLGNIQLKNRFVRSSTWEGMATEEGASTPRLNRLMQDLAEGDCGLLLSSHAYVQKSGQAGPWQLGIHQDSLIPSLKEMCKAVHLAGGKVFAQLAHAGANADASLSGQELQAPTATENIRGQQSRTMTLDDIQLFKDDFVAAARRALLSGFDGIQIHAAHGYALSQFLSPYYNKRTDAYGGNVENRARLLIEIYSEIKSVVPNSFPVLIKINADDFLEGGFTPEMMVETVLELEKLGIDAVELSGGGGPKARYIASRAFDPQSAGEEGYYRDAARLYKSRISTPLMLVGGIRSLEGAQQILDEGLADMIALCRPLIAEPGLIKRWQSGNLERSTCISCEGCRNPARLGEGIRCVIKNSK